MLFGQAKLPHGPLTNIFIELRNIRSSRERERGVAHTKRMASRNTTGEYVAPTTQAIPTMAFPTTLPVISTPVTDLQSINTAITQLNVAVQQVHYGLSQCYTSLALLSQDSSYINQQQYFHNNIALSTAERLRVLEESVEWLARQNEKFQKTASEENGCNDSAFANPTSSISLADVSNLQNLTSHLPAPPPPSPAAGSK